ncbi:GIY-YIG nuclease family protein [Nostoc linckia FACHB-104]|nr:GIY-YIG nuclease family protein [Nostoc linckia FACHB-104]
MINPSTINPLALPSMPLGWKKALPKCACIYFAIDASNQVQYIGQTHNLKTRWINHHRLKHLQDMDGVRLAWMEISDTSLLPEIEQALIAWFDPPINRLRDGTCNPSTDKTRVSTYIDQRLKELAEKVGASQGRSLSNYVEQLIKQDVIRAQKEGEITD